MIKFREQKIIAVKDWDNLVKKLMVVHTLSSNRMTVENVGCFI